MSNTAEKSGNKSEITHDYLLGELGYKLDMINNVTTETTQKSNVICNASNDTHIDGSNTWLVHLINNLEKNFDDTPFDIWIYGKIDDCIKNGIPKGNNGARGYIYAMFVFVHLHPVIESGIQIHPGQETAYKIILRKVKSTFYLKETYPDKYPEQLTQLEKNVKKIL
ncbi:MAG: hypothetical protein GY828_04865 [Candidatus Gracilibacteria bacterium]|nr:hypothetical protein [Candidatus Gracilibacteria bacterium]